jgi:fido (protein-threonine AMPylation protein)
VLRNKLGLSATGELETAEREITHAALILLKESPVQPSYDLRHLCAIHRRVFGDIYDWAGQLRTVAIAKGTWFCLPQYIESAAAEVFQALHGESLLRGLPHEVSTRSARATAEPSARSSSSFPVMPASSLTGSTSTLTATSRHPPPSCAETRPL